MMVSVHTSSYSPPPSISLVLILAIVLSVPGSGNPPQLPPPCLPLIVFRLVLESPNWIGGRAHVEVVELLVEHEGPLNELRRLLPALEAVHATAADVADHVGGQDGAVGTQDHHRGNLGHLEHGLQLSGGNKRQQ